MMRGNHRRLNLFRGNQVEQLFKIFKKESGKGDNYILHCFGQNAKLYFFTFILIKRAKLNKTSFFISITLKFASFTYHSNLNTYFLQ